MTWRKAWFPLYLILVGNVPSTSSLLCFSVNKSLWDYYHLSCSPRVTNQWWAVRVLSPAASICTCAGESLCRSTESSFWDRFQVCSWPMSLWKNELSSPGSFFLKEIKGIASLNIILMYWVSQIANIDNLYLVSSFLSKGTCGTREDWYFLRHLVLCCIWRKQSISIKY